MLQSFFKVAIRYFKRNKLYTLINIFGLSVGIASALIIFLFVTHELSYDKFHTRLDNIYRVNMDTRWGEYETNRNTTPPPVGPMIMEEFPEVELSTRVRNVEEVIKVGDRVFREEEVLATDSNFFQIFDFQFLEGQSSSALDEPYSILISPTLAQKYFGSEHVLGELMLVGESQQPFKVTGIIEPSPTNSHIRFDAITSIQSYEDVAFFEWSWIWTQLVTYIMVKPETDMTNFVSKVQASVDEKIPYTFNRVGFPFEEFKEAGGYWKLVFQPAAEIRLYSQGWGNDLGGISDIQHIYIFAIIGLVILILACINYINLNTATSTSRAKEVGLRKTLGSTKNTLAQQFLVESIFLVGCSSIVALGLVELLRPFFSAIVGESLPWSVIPWYVWVLGGTIFVLFIGALSGGYPAFYLTTFQPAKVLKSMHQSGKQSAHFRNALVVIQFSISVFMVIATWVIYQQLEFMRNKDLGFQKENVVTLRNVELLKDNREFLKREMTRLDGVFSASYSTAAFPNFQSFDDTYIPENSEYNDITLTSIITDSDFIETLKLKLGEGRNFKDGQPEPNSILLNEAAVKQAGWTQGAGQTLTYPEFSKFEVIGVIADFHYLPIQYRVEPLMILTHDSGHPYEGYEYLHLRISGEDVPATLSKVKELWDRIAPEWPLEYEFIDEEFDKGYRAQARLSQIFYIFSTIAICIACLGLMGLSAFIVRKRIKEISIRKILGASIQSILGLISKEFALVIVVAIVIASPIAYYIMQQWLNNFLEPISLSPSIFLISGILILLIAIMTVSLHALRAAFTNPATILRDE